MLSLTMLLISVKNPHSNIISGTFHKNIIYTVMYDSECINNCGRVSLLPAKYIRALHAFLIFI